MGNSVSLGNTEGGTYSLFTTTGSWTSTWTLTPPEPSRLKEAEQAVVARAIGDLIVGRFDKTGLIGPDLIDSFLRTTATGWGVTGVGTTSSIPWTSIGSGWSTGTWSTGTTSISFSYDEE